MGRRAFSIMARVSPVNTSGHDAGAAPEIVELTSQFVHSSAATVGSFTCANPLVNRIHGLIDAAIESNLQSVLTDCPHREKLGGSNARICWPAASCTTTMSRRFYTKIVNDMSEAQLANGMVPDIAPNNRLPGRLP